MNGTNNYFLLSQRRQ